jgi:uncharacterized protein YjbI with pentapeptide repeats
MIDDMGKTTNRWQTPAGAKLAREVFKRLVVGQSLSDLNLGQYEGRVDLRGIRAPQVTKEELGSFRGWSVEKLQGYLEFRNVRFENLDFSRAELRYCRFFTSRIVNCRFDGARCESWGLWGVDVINSSFRGAGLRDAALGPWYEGRGSTYRSVDFSRADIRGATSSSATYVDCDFSNSRLDKIDFQSSSFVRCRFAGSVREVLFYDLAFGTKKQNPNLMEDVDFSEAQLHWVAFRRLNLDRVRLPEDKNHLIVKNYRCVLQRALAAVKDDESRHGRGLRRVLANYLKWAGPKQAVGVFNRLDFAEAWGKEGEEFAVELLHRAEQDCSTLQ